MICESCRSQDHKECINGDHTIGTRCDCQHRVVVTDTDLALRKDLYEKGNSNVPRAASD